MKHDLFVSILLFEQEFDEKDFLKKQQIKIIIIIFCFSLPGKYPSNK
jgi:hypothetical protein